MKYAILSIIIGTFACVHADIVFFKNGSTMEGDVRDNGKTIRITMPAGVIEVPKSLIEKITKTQSVMEILEQKKKTIAVGDADAWFRLYQWAVANKFPDEDLSELLFNALRINPEHPGANEALADLMESKQRTKKPTPVAPPVEEPERQEIRQVERRPIQQERRPVQEQNPIQEGINRGSPFFGGPAEHPLEEDINKLFEQSISTLPPNQLAERGGLNILFTFIRDKALRNGFTEDEAVKIANDFKNIAGVGGDRAFQSFQKTFFLLQRLYQNPDPFRAAISSRFTNPIPQDLFMFLISVSAKVATGGDRAADDFNRVYRLVFFRVYDSYYMGVNSEPLAYRIAVKTAAIVAGGGGFGRFRRSFNFHFREYRRRVRDRREEAVPYAIIESVKENIFPRRLFIPFNRR